MVRFELVSFFILSFLLRVPAIHGAKTTKNQTHLVRFAQLDEG